MPGYFGDPYVNCKPECIQNSECSYDKACVNNKCVEACAINGICGSFAECRVVNHAPMCHCIAGFTGNPSIKCYKNREYLPPCKTQKIHMKHIDIHSLIILFFLKIHYSIHHSKTIHSKPNTRSHRSMFPVTMWSI